MKRTIGFVSLIALTISNSIAGIVNYSKLNEKEQEYIETNLDNNLIKYDPNTDEIILDKNLENHLRELGILNTQDSTNSGVCGGRGGGGGA